MIYMTPEYEVESLPYYPLNNARILWDNVLASATFTATSEIEGFEAANAQATDTASWWWPSVAGTLTMTLSGAASISSVGIAAHSLGGEGVGVTVQGLVGATWTTLHPEIVPDDNSAMMIMFASVTVTAVRLILDGSARIGVVYAGSEMIMPQRVYTAAPPLSMVISTEYQTNKSQTGQFMGRSIMANARPFDVSWTHLHETWVRSDFYPFILAARRDPFFVALRPAGYPDDVGYVWTSSDIVPARMGLKDFIEVQVSGTAHVEPDL